MVSHDVIFSKINHFIIVSIIIVSFYRQVRGLPLYLAEVTDNINP
jgi:hypothetical protein